MTDNWEDTGPQGHPVIAMLAGGAVLVLGALLGPLFATPLPLPSLLLGGAAVGLVLWLVGFVVTTRRAGLGWKLGSLALMLGAGAGAGAIAHGQFQTKSRADASSFAEIELAPDGAPIFPAGAAGRGPISRLYSDAVRADASERRAFADALGKSGAPTLTSPYLLQQNPKLIADCRSLEPVRALAAEHGQQRSARRAALAQAIGTASLPGSAKQGIATIAGDPRADARLANQQAMLAATADLCALLARRSWYNDNGYFAFRSGADAAAFRALNAKRVALAGEESAIDRASRDRVTAGRDQVRKALSQSIYTGE